MNDNFKSGSVQALENAMKNGRLPHGVVLESTQPQLLQQYIKKLSKWAVCKESNKPCDACSQCKKVETENHPDIYTAQLAGKTEVVNVDEIRKICNDAYIKPNEAETKVYIIPNADKMQIQAQNAFLKVLEEPPQNILFILCCTSAQQLLLTIRSRVTVYKLGFDAIDDENAQRATKKAQQIAKVLTVTKGYELLCATLFTDRVFAKNVLERLLLIVNSAVKAKVANINCNDVEQLLADSLSTQNLIDILDIITTAEASLNSNINMNLFSSWFCAELRRQK
ncbi:MAG: hypothetical protein UHY68_06905 [Acutalibacteraceae bacterium]|nr:hypothetical protein [Acutalibacteraceae bacterium]